MNNNKRTCVDCNETKDLIEGFYPTGKGGHYAKNCKECRKVQMALQKRDTYDIDKQRIKSIKRRDDGRSKENFNRQVNKFPEKNKARVSLRNAVKQGKVDKLPCEVCGGKKPQGHHEDYSKPLEVTWLCQKHHSEIHRKHIIKAINQDHE